MKLARLFWLAPLALALGGCTGVADTRIAPAPTALRAPVKSMTIIVDTDVIGAAFAAYRGTLPFGSTTGDYQGFITHMVEGLQAEAKAANIDATVEAVSLRTTRRDALRSQGRPVLTVRATSYTSRKELVGGRDLGWAGDTAWEMTLAERPAGSAAYAVTWKAGIRNENLNPTLCGNYSRCSRSLAERVFAQMRRDGLFP